MIELNTEKKSLEDFGKTLAIVLFLLSSFWAYKDSVILAARFQYAAIFFALLSLFWPRSIKWLYIVWITLANWIAGHITTLLLSTVYLLFITPYSLLLKCFKRHLLKKSIQSHAATYWESKPKKTTTLKQYQRQF